MTVRFKCQSEYQRSYRSRSVSPQRCAPLAGLRSDYMGISREPCLHRRKKFINHDPLHSCGSMHQTPAEPVPDTLTTKPPAAPKKQQIQPVESEPPPAPRPDGDLSGKPLDIEKSASRPSSVKLRSSKTENRPHSSSHSPAASNPQQHFSRNHALYRKAGLKSAGPRSGLHKTEYDRQFYFKKTPGAPSPILTAHQALYSSHRSVPPFKKNPVSMETEYQHSFQVQALPTGPRLRKNLEHERMPLFHTHLNKKKKDLPKNKSVSKSESPILEKEGKKSVSPKKELPPDPAPSTAPVQRRHRILTEYEARYGSPLNKIPEEGEAMVSHTPQVKELREQAQSHRRRAWGTNFSRDHLSQLLSEHNALWEPSETLDSATDPHPTHFDLFQVSSADPDSCRTSCVEALDLASHSSRSSWRTSAVGSKDAADNQSPLSECNLASAEEDELSDAEEDGRLPTPKLKMLLVQRTHHDLTTPAAGGAILVGKTSDESSAHNQATFAIQRAGTAESVLANAETVEQIPVKPKEASSEDCIHHNRPASSPVCKPIKQTSPVTTVPPPTVPLHCIQGTLRHADFQHNGELGLRFKERPCTGGCCGSDEDDRLSVMSWRSAASCSMASAVLERAQKRRENFWGKR